MRAHVGDGERRNQSISTVEHAKEELSEKFTVLYHSDTDVLCSNVTWGVFLCIALCRQSLPLGAYPASKGFYRMSINKILKPEIGIVRYTGRTFNIILSGSKYVCNWDGRGM
jgi:hypothetical protein